MIGRVRPLLGTELEKDVIVNTSGSAEDNKTTVRIPNPRNESEALSFQFNSVYDRLVRYKSLSDKSSLSSRPSALCM